MLKIRLTRVGRKHDPSFRMVVTDSKKAPQSGAYLENLGFCDFRKDRFQLKPERINYWISQGAQVSDTAYNILVSQKITKGKKRSVSGNKLGKKKRAKQEAVVGDQGKKEKEEVKEELKEGEKQEKKQEESLSDKQSDKQEDEKKEKKSEDGENDEKKKSA